MKSTASKKESRPFEDWSGSGFTCNGGCARPVPEQIGTISFCGTCWRVREVLLRERAESLAELARRGCPRERSLARIADLIRRTGVDDAEDLIGQLRLR
jgi:hypothetical protein